MELNPGLNLLQAPNEAGKSTWCAFLLAMFYGINSRERDRAGVPSGKTLRTPWSGAAMSGQLDCRTGDGRSLSLYRSTRRAAAPMAEFQATLLGVSREVFARSAFIGQSGLAITQDAGLERRIAALITSGEEDTSYSEAAGILKKELNRRRHNKTGQLPALEAELQETEDRLTLQRELARQLESVQNRSEGGAVLAGALCPQTGRGPGRSCGATGRGPCPPGAGGPSA